MWKRGNKQPKRLPWLKVRPTPVGTRFLLLLLVIGFAAYNTRNNLIYIMLSVGLATVAVSAVAAHLSLKNISVRRGEPADLYAGTPSMESLRITNGSCFFDAYGVGIDDLDGPVAPARKGSGKRSDVFLTHLGRGHGRSFELEKTYPRRGIYKKERLALTTRYPFGLFRVDRQVRLERRLVVFPEVFRVDVSFLFQERFGSVPQRLRGGESEELLRVREYNSGDNFHHIHWKASAKLGNLMVREFAGGRQRRFTVVFDNTVGGDDDTFEKTVSAVASLVVHLSSHGLPFQLVTGDEVFPHDFSLEHLRGVLTHLAVVEPADAPKIDLLSWSDSALRGGDVVVILPASKGGRWELRAPALHFIDAEAILPKSEAAGA
jgi:uncharacterized protein (DUF58 family)